QEVGTLETPLVMPIVRQLLGGPFVLYGPFGGKNPAVLIHAPLYYHLAALLAWPLVRAGLAPEPASLVAGRSLSLLGLLATMVAVDRLARLDGAPRRAGTWAVLLVAAAPVVAGVSSSVRPDLFGIALQTTGAVLVLAALRGESGRSQKLLAGYLCFG